MANQKPAYVLNKDKYVLCMFQMVRNHRVDVDMYYSIMRDIEATANDYSLISTPYTEDEYAKQRAWQRETKGVA